MIIFYILLNMPKRFHTSSDEETIIKFVVLVGQFLTQVDISCVFIVWHQQV